MNNLRIIGTKMNNLRIMGNILPVVVRMVTKVKDRPYFFVIITRLLKDNLKRLVNKQPKTEDKKK